MLSQCIAGEVVAGVAAAAELPGTGDPQRYLADIIVAVPGRVARNAAPVSLTLSTSRGSGAGARTPELDRNDCHFSLVVPCSRTTSTVPGVTQNVLPLSALVRLRVRVARCAAGQDIVAPDGAVADGVAAVPVAGVAGVTGVVEVMGVDVDDAVPAAGAEAA